MGEHIGHTLRSFQLRTWAGRESSKTCKRTSAEKWNLEFAFKTFLCCIPPTCHGSWSVICPKINIILLPDQHSTTYRSHLIRAFSLESQREVGGCLFYTSINPETFEDMFVWMNAKLKYWVCDQTCFANVTLKQIRGHTSLLWTFHPASPMCRNISFEYFNHHTYTLPTPL